MYVDVPQRHEANTFYAEIQIQFPLIRSGRVKDVLTISEVRTQFPRYLPKSEHMPEGVNINAFSCHVVDKYLYFVENSVSFISNADWNARKCLYIYHVSCIYVQKESESNASCFKNNIYIGKGIDLIYIIPIIRCICMF